MRMLVAAAVLLASLAAHAQDITAFVGVNVLPMDSERVLRGQTVVVRDGRITHLGPVSDVEVPAGARVLYSDGGWLMPGLIDSHVHIRAQDLDAYINSGITTVRDLAGTSQVLSVVTRVNNGTRVGPRILPATMLMNGPNPSPDSARFATIVNNPNDAAAIVDLQLSRGATFVKLYENLSQQTFDALVAAARARNVRVGGHIAFNVDIHHALDKVDFIEHLAGYERVVTTRAGAGGFGAWPAVDESRFAPLVAETVAKGVWNCPTLHVFDVLAQQNFVASERERLVENRRRFVRALHDGGARLLLGTDCGFLVPAGTALFEEMREFRSAGLTPYEVLVTATRAPAEFLGMQNEIGTIAVGRQADLLLLSANPFDDLEILRRPTGVMLRGTWIAFPKRRTSTR